MILSLDNLHFYLLENGTLDTASLVDGSYTASQSKTRNITFNVTRKNGKHLFVKQLTQFDTPNSYILQKDATCLWLIKNEPAFAALSQYVPSYFGYDTENQVLITEFLPEARNMEMFLRLENGELPLFTETLCNILAALHIPLTETLLNVPSMRFFQKQIPWVMNLGIPNTGAQQTGSPVMQTVLTNPDFQAMLRDARNRYDFTSLIHGDIKWMNFLVNGPKGREKINLIDWEIADIGDPLWDVAGIFMSILMMAVAESPYQPKDMSGFPINEPIKALAPCWPLMAGFWRTYLQKINYTLHDTSAGLEKALHFTGARLIQTAIEYNMHSNELNPNANRLLLACIALFQHRDFVLSQLQMQQPISA
jgi:Phosphotransferase enzyme family